MFHLPDLNSDLDGRYSVYLSGLWIVVFTWLDTLILTADFPFTWLDTYFDCRFSVYLTGHSYLDCRLFCLLDWHIYLDCKYSVYLTGHTDFRLKIVQFTSMDTLIWTADFPFTWLDTLVTCRTVDCSPCWTGHTYLDQSLFCLLDWTHLFVWTADCSVYWLFRIFFV
jgi:hypothetical protein